MVTSEHGAVPPGRRSHAGPEDPVLHGQWRRDRRAVARAHHPDLGGDPAVMDRLLAELDATYARAEGVPDAVHPIRASPADRALQPLRRAVRRAHRHLQRAHRAGRARLPRGWPGRQRYFDL